MGAPVRPGAFESDLAGLQTLRKRLLVTRMRSEKRAKLLDLANQLHDGLREIVEAPVQKRASQQSSGT